MARIQTETFQTYNYECNKHHNQTHPDLATRNSELILNYDKVLVRESLAKATRRKQLEMLLSLGLLKRDWYDVTKDLQVGFVEK